MTPFINAGNLNKRIRRTIFVIASLSILVVVIFSNRISLIHTSRRQLLALSLLQHNMFGTMPQISTANRFLNSSVAGERSAAIPLILLWTNWFGEPWPYEEGRVICGREELKCDLTRDQTYYDMSKALVFHGADTGCSEPAFFPEDRRMDQVWVYHNMENPIISSNMGVQLSDLFNGIFNWTMTYSRDADIVTPYGSVVKGKFENGYQPTRNYAEGKTHLIAWASSKCYEGRTQFVRNLSQHIEVDMFGECGNSYCPRDEECWRYITKHYKFYLSFENKICKDYVTEKFYNNALRRGLVPIVVGGANYRDHHVAPPGSYIDALQFDNIKELAQYIAKVAADDRLYNSFFRWRSNYSIIEYDQLDYFCALCKRLHKNTKPDRIRYDFSSFWNPDTSNCRPYPIADDSRIKPQFKYFYPSDSN